jgi:hypothetical protein
MKSAISLKKLTYFVNISWPIVSLIFWKDLLWFQDFIWDDKFKDYNWLQDNRLEWAGFSNIKISHQSQDIFRILIQENILQNHSIFIKFGSKFDSNLDKTIQLKIQFEYKTIPKSKTSSLQSYIAHYIKNKFKDPKTINKKSKRISKRISILKKENWYIGIQTSNIFVLSW